MVRIAFVLMLMLLPASHAVAASWLDGYRAAADALVADFNRKSTARFVAMLDKETMVGEIMVGIGGEAAQAADLRKGFRTALERAGERMIGQMPEGGYVKLLRVGRKDGSVRALIRFDWGDNGFSYCDFVLKETDDRGVVIRDWFDYSSGRFYSEAVRAMILVALDRAEALRGITRADLKHNDVMAFFRMIRGKQFKQAIKTYKSLSDSMRRNRSLIYVYVQAAAMSGDMALYREALAMLTRYYGDDPRFAFLLVDYYFLTGDYAGAARVLDLAAKDMGVADAALLARKANAWLAAGAYDSARKFAEESVALEPALETPYWALLQICAHDGDFDKTVVFAEVLQDRFHYRLDAEFFAASDNFDGFVKSGQYRQWISRFE